MYLFYQYFYTGIFSVTVLMFWSVYNKMIEWLYKSVVPNKDTDVFTNRWSIFIHREY